MKHVKLFEQFLMEKRAIPKFFMPNLYKMSPNVTSEMVYILRMDYTCDCRIYALVNAAKMKEIYEALNMKMIADKIAWFIENIVYPSDPIYMPEDGKVNHNYKLEVQATKDWRVDIVSEIKSSKFPYYVYFGGTDPSGGMIQKIQDVKKDCKTCSDPGKVDLTPDEKAEYNLFQIEGKYCFMNNDLVAFDPDMESKFTKKVFPDSEGNSPLDDGYEDWLLTGYYVKFDDFSCFLSSLYPGYQEISDRFLKDSVTVGINNILDLLSYKKELAYIKKFTGDKENSREVIDSIFSYLVDEQFPIEYISKVAEFLNVDDYKVKMLPYHSLEIVQYSQQQMNWANPPAFSPTPNFKGSIFSIALPGDPQIAKAILNKIPKTYEEIYDGLDSLTPTQLEKIKNNSDMSWKNTSAEDFLEGNLKKSVYIVDPSKFERKELALYDDVLPSVETFGDETNCSFNYGIYKDVSLDEISRMSPIELYLKVFGLLK